MELGKKFKKMRIVISWNELPKYAAYPLREIIKNNLNFLKKGGKFIIPIPKIKIISYKKSYEKN